MSVTVPIDEPLTSTLPPIIGSPVPSFTIPFTVIFCAKAVTDKKDRTSTNTFFINFTLIIFELFIHFSFLVKQYVLI